MGYPPKYAKDPFPPGWSSGPNPYQVGGSAPQRGSSAVTLVIVMVIVLLAGTCLLTMVAGTIAISVAGYRAEKARREQAQRVFDEVRRQDATMNRPPVQPMYDPTESFDRVQQDIDRRNEERRREHDEQIQRMLEDSRRRHEDMMRDMRERMEQMRTSPPGRPGF